LYAALLGFDLLAIAAGFLLPVPFIGIRGSIAAVLIVACFLYSIIAFNSGAFSLRSGQAVMIDSGSAVRSLLMTYGTLFLISYFLRLDRDMSRLLLAMAMGGSIVLLVLFRQLTSLYVESHLRNRLFLQLLVHDGVDVAVPGEFAVLDAKECGIRPDMRDPAMLDRFAHTIMGYDRVVITCHPASRANWAMMLKGADVRGEIVVGEVDTFGALGLSRMSDVPTLVVSVGPLSLRKAIAKRAFDLAFALPAVIALAPALLLTAVAIKLDSRGPVLFKQRRVGRGNKFFYILKFRSMRVEQTDSDGRVSASRDDDRITRVGYFIRRTSVDELPQLLNVLFGQMSIVGPRPHALGSLAGEQLFWDIDERYWHRHTLKPGITGLAQVRGFRGATNHTIDLTRRLQADLEYIANWSFWRDLAIVLMTMRVVVHRNTY
jgi:lipopolysaccharide/colanic/teichoic acid biosynthesis glycosyltransferase